MLGEAFTGLLQKILYHLKKGCQAKESSHFSSQDAIKRRINGVLDGRLYLITLVAL